MRIKMPLKVGNYRTDSKIWTATLYHIPIIEIKKIINEANSEYPDETAHKEPSHLDLHCLQMCGRMYLMSESTRLYPTFGHPKYVVSKQKEISLVCKVLMIFFTWFCAAFSWLSVPHTL